MNNIITQDRHQLTKPALQMLLGGGLLIIFVAIIILVGRPGAAPPAQSPLAEAAVINQDAPDFMAQATPTVTYIPSPTPPAAPLVINRITVTPPANGRVITLTAAADAVGWASDLDGRSHFNMPSLHAGLYQGFTYYSALKFDLSPVPPGSTISLAVLELVGLDDGRLGQNGSWRLELLDSSLDEHWPDLDFAMLAAATPTVSTPLDMTLNKLAPDNANRFIFDDQGRAALEQRLGKKNISFRLAGPNTGADNLFSWHSGYSRQADAGRMVILSLGVMPPAATPGKKGLSGGDVTGDGQVDIFDLVLVAARYHTSDSAADINSDGQVDIFDLTLVAGRYGQAAPAAQ